MSYWDDIATTGQADDNMCHVPVDRCLARLDPIVTLAPGYVLELGCGVGRLTEPLARLLYSTNPEAMPLVEGVDISQAMLNIARDRRTVSNVYYRVCDGLNIPNVYGYPLDAAYSIGMFQHIPDDTMHGYIKQLHSRLRAGGVFIFQFVYEGESGELSFIRHPAEVVGWMGEWATVQVSDDEENRWSWVTAVK